MRDSVNFPAKKLRIKLQVLMETLLRSHTMERARGMRFTEEARAERLANLIRFSFASIWLFTVSFYVPKNLPRFNAINLTAGAIFMLVAVSYHVWLSRHPYRSAYKYVLTALDMAMAIGVLVAYAVAAGPVFVLKMPIYLMVPCAVGLAALRTQRRLALYAGVLSIVMLVGFWAWMQLWYGIDYGTRMEHAFGPKINPTYLIDTIAFLLCFASTGIAASYNMRRQINLRVTEAEILAREEERELMAAGLAHEIRNPLGGIYGYAQLLRDEGKGTPGYADAILQDTRRLNDVVEGFLHFARPYTVHPVDVDVMEVVRAICLHEAESRPATPIDFVTATDSLRIRTDPAAMRQVLVNLLQNARRFQREGAPVRVGVTGDAAEVRVEVEDEGPGVSSSLLPRLFSPFQTSGPGGTGLGLSLSRKLARALGGDLIHAPRGTGARFVLVLRPYIGQGDS